MHTFFTFINIAFEVLVVNFRQEKKNTVHQNQKRRSKMITISIWDDTTYRKLKVSTKKLFSSVQFTDSIVSKSSPTPWPPALQASLSSTSSLCLLKLSSIESMMPSNHLILLSLPSIFPSIRVFSNDSALCIRWPKYWSFSFSISLSNEYSGLISFRMDWLDLLEVHGSLKSLLQHHSSKASIL